MPAMRRSTLATLAVAAVLTTLGLASSAGAATQPFLPIHLQHIALPKGFAASTPIFTRDGHHLVFSAGGHLYRVGDTGKGLTCLSCGLPNEPKIEPAVQEAFKDVFPDGKRIMWGDFTHLWVLECSPSVVDCAKRTLLPVDVSASAPAGGTLTLDTGVWHLAPDGKHLGWTATRLDVRPMLVGTLTRTATKYVATDVRAINPPGPTSPTDTDPRGWTNASALYEMKGFSPDGRSVNYVSSQYEGNPDVWSVNLKTGRVTRVTGNPDWDEDNGISPDDRLMMLHSDRGMHRVDAAGLVPRRAFIDYPISANAAIYYVGTTTGFQCDLQPWLLPASGDRGGKLIGQPLDPYTGGDVHAQNNVPGRGAWNRKSTEVALTEMSYKTGLGVNRLLVAHLDRKATKPVKVVSSQPGSWAPTPDKYKGVSDANRTVTVHGLKSGTAKIVYQGTLAGGFYSVAYTHYSDDGRSFVDGTESIDTPAFSIMPATNKADITLSGARTGRLKADFKMGRLNGTPTASGTVSASLDGYKLAGSVQKLGPCPTKLPTRQPLKLKTRASGARLLVTVTADSAPTVHAADGYGDVRPVQGAVVRVGGRRVVTDARGRATVRLRPGHRRVTASAGDTFIAVAKRVRIRG
jgi:hypothetical protein